MQNFKNGFHRRVLEKYLAEIDKIPRLSHEQELALARRIQAGDKQAMDELVRANLKFVVFIAREYEERGLPFDELVSEGNLGLMEAARRFDADRGYKFISYAVWWIRQAIMRAVAKHSRLVRLPINRIGILGKFSSTVKNLEQDLGRAPALEEVADMLEISTTELSKNLTHWTNELSLDDSTLPFDGSLSLLDRLESNEFAEPSSKLLEESLKIDIQSALDSLSTAESTVLRLYFGLDCERPLTLLEIGNQMNLSRERIRQIKQKAVRKLQYVHRREKLRNYL